jgi:hypothetical protein
MFEPFPTSWAFLYSATLLIDSHIALRPDQFWNDDGLPGILFSSLQQVKCVMARAARWQFLVKSRRIKFMAFSGYHRTGMNGTSTLRIA